MRKGFNQKISFKGLLNGTYLVSKGNYLYGISKSNFYDDPEEVYKQGKASRVTLQDAFGGYYRDTSTGFELFKKYFEPKAMANPCLTFKNLMAKAKAASLKH